MNKKIILLLLGLVLISGCGVSKTCAEFVEVYYCEHEVSCNGSLSSILIFSDSELNETKIIIDIERDYPYYECSDKEIFLYEYDSEFNKTEYIYNGTYNTNITLKLNEPSEDCFNLYKRLECSRWTYE